MVSFFFAADFELLTEAERTVLRRLAELAAAGADALGEGGPFEARTLRRSLQRLLHLGFVRRDEERRYALVNGFFRRWLQETPLTRPLSA